MEGGIDDGYDCRDGMGLSVEVESGKEGGKDGCVGRE